MKIPTPAERSVIRDRCERATPGPWAHRNAGTGYDQVDNLDGARAPRRVVLAKEQIHGLSEDYAFIASARADLPLCLDALDEAERLLRHALPHLTGRLKADVAAFLGSPPRRSK
jgi:hypothetical protein